MKKTIIILLLILFIITPVVADTGYSIREDSTQTVRLSVTTYNTVYLGVAENEVNSSIVPPSISEMTFSYNPRTMNWETDSFFFYVISFVTSPLVITLTPSEALKNGESTIDWRNTTSTPTFSSLSSSSLTYTTDGSGVSTVDDLMLKEEPESSYTYPRVYSWEMKLVVDGDTPVEAKKYTGEFILKVNTKT